MPNHFFSDTTTLSGVAAGVKLGKNLKIAPDVIISDGAVIGDYVTIEPGVIIYENVHIGSHSFVGAQCILGERQTGFFKDKNYENPTLIIGQNSIIRSGTIIYSGCSMGEEFQTGHRAVIRENSIFGADCSFGTLSQSDGHIKVGNNCRFHNNVFIATYTTIADNVHFYPMSCTVDSLHPPCQKGRKGPTIEAGVIIGAKALLLPRIVVGSGAVIAGGAIVTRDVPASMLVAGAPAKVVKPKSEIRCRLEDRPAYE
jgi:acetyltransferase-like isoleucine patch superfamily enzyme